MVELESIAMQLFLLEDRTLGIRGIVYPIQSPYLSIANPQAEIMMWIASKFGLTPASRSRIAAPSSAEPSLFDLLEGGDSQ
jgi:hypothetical protein